MAKNKTTRVCYAGTNDLHVEATILDTTLDLYTDMREAVATGFEVSESERDYIDRRISDLLERRDQLRRQTAVAALRERRALRHTR